MNKESLFPNEAFQEAPRFKHQDQTHLNHSIDDFKLKSEQDPHQQKLNEIKSIYDEQSGLLNEEQLENRQNSEKMLDAVIQDLPSEFRLQAMTNFYDSQVKTFEASQNMDIPKQGSLDIETKEAEINI